MLKLGVIGTGMIGRDHIRRITTVLSGALVVAVTDVFADAATEVAAGIGARVHTTGEDLIADPEVDAVLVCSSGPSHEQYVLAAIAAGKPVFCEKPLATTQDACLRIVEAEAAYGSRLVQVGFMRRYDSRYRALKADLDSGRIGEALLMHCAHRNPGVPASYTTEMAIVDTAVHEIDMVRWMFGREIAAARVLLPRRSGNGGELQDPLLLILETGDAILIDVETSVNIRYGYDIRGEIVGEHGTAVLDSPAPAPADWRERFITAYDTEIQEWIDAITTTGQPTGPTAWDGYAAAVICDAGVAALHSGDRVAVVLAEQPKLYLTTEPAA